MGFAVKVIVPLLTLLGFIKILFAATTYDDKNVIFYIDRCNGVCNKDYCRMNVSCRPHNRTMKWQILDINFHKGVVLEAPLYMRIIAYKKFRTEYKQFMLDVKGELCHELVAKNHPVLHLTGGYGRLKVNGTFLDPCPLTGRRYVEPRYTKTYPIPLVPKGEWRLDFLISKTIKRIDTLIGSVSFYVTIKPTSSEEF